MDSLFLKIEEAETCRDNSLAFQEALVGLSNNPAASIVLANEMRAAAADAEIQWREIEQMPEFKSRYTSRDAARADFLREMWKKE